MKKVFDILVQNVDKVVYALGAVCVLLVAADLFYDKGGHYDFEKVIGFHAMYGFASYVGLVLVAKQLRRVLMRPEDHYEDPETADPYENVSGEEYEEEVHP